MLSPHILQVLVSYSGFSRSAERSSSRLKVIGTQYRRRAVRQEEFGLERYDDY